MKKHLVFITLLLGGAMNGQATTSPSSLIVKVFEMRVSKNSDCTAAITVFKTASPTAVDLISQPVLGSGSIPDGTYHCLMFHVDDLVTLVPMATTGVCTGGVPVTLDMFSDPVNDVSISPDGMVIHATPGGEDDPWVYFSDSNQALAVNNCFEPNTSGCACSGPCPLTPLTISSDQTHNLVLDLVNRVDGSGSSCTLLLPPGLKQSALSIR
jgi:hypothetical protein